MWTKETINQQIVKPKKVNKMKKMNNIYEAPKAEVIELNASRDLMQNRFDVGTPTAGETSVSDY
jgi:hypothetical protein